MEDGPETFDRHRCLCINSLYEMSDPAVSNVYTTVTQSTHSHGVVASRHRLASPDGGICHGSNYWGADSSPLWLNFPLTMVTLGVVVGFVYCIS